MTRVTGRVSRTWEVPAATSTRAIASGPYATELRASRESATSPWTLVRRLLSPSPWRNWSFGRRRPASGPRVDTTARDGSNVRLVSGFGTPASAFGNARVRSVGVLFGRFSLSGAPNPGRSIPRTPPIRLARRQKLHAGFLADNWPNTILWPRCSGSVQDVITNWTAGSSCRRLSPRERHDGAGTGGRGDLT